jgi:hypothetical protein
MTTKLMRPRIFGGIGFVGAMGDEVPEDPFCSGESANQWLGKALSLLFTFEVVLDADDPQEPPSGFRLCYVEAMTLEWIAGGSVPVDGHGRIVMVKWDYDDFEGLLRTMVNDCMADSPINVSRRLMTRFWLDHRGSVLMGEPAPWDSPPHPKAW